MWDLWALRKNFPRFFKRTKSTNFEIFQFYRSVFPLENWHHPRKNTFHRYTRRQKSFSITLRYARNKERIRTAFFWKLYASILYRITNANWWLWLFVFIVSQWFKFLGFSTSTSTSTNNVPSLAVTVNQSWFQPNFLQYHHMLVFIDPRLEGGNALVMIELLEYRRLLGLLLLSFLDLTAFCGYYLSVSIFVHIIIIYLCSNF